MPQQIKEGKLEGTCLTNPHESLTASFGTFKKL